MDLAERRSGMLCSRPAVPYYMKINGFDVAMDTTDELQALVGRLPTQPLALPAMSPRPSSRPPRPPAAEAPGGAAGVVPAGAVRSKNRYGDLPERLKALSPYWKTLPPKMLQCVELRAAGNDNHAIAAKTGKTVGSVSVTVNLARRRLEAARAASSEGARETSPGDDDGDGDEDEGGDEDDEPEPDVDADVEVGEGAKLESPAVDKFFSGATGGNGLFAYFRSLRRYPLLSREEEHEIATRFAATRDPKLAQALVQANLRFVVKIANGYTQERGKLIDIIQEGNVGLMRAVQKFDPSKGMRLTTYAKHWIHAYMKIYIIKDKRLVCIGTNQPDRTIFWSLAKTRFALRKEKTDGSEPTDEEVAKALKVKVSRVTAMATRLTSEKNMDPSPGDVDEATPSDWLTDGRPLQDELCERREEVEKMSQILDGIRRTLNPRMLHILEARLLAEEPMTLEEMSQSYGVSRERIRQLEEKLKVMIKRRLESDLRAVA
jgi:RNA polymerase sigma-32 factor